MYIIFLILIFILLCISFFYRCPKPKIIKNNFNTVYSPAYGRIIDISKKDNKLFIAIFLSPLDIHYQFFPISGTIINREYDSSGKFNLAYDLNKSKYNEKHITTIRNYRGDFIIYQIAGFMVRRIEIFNEKKDYINTGEKLGLIHFGSRVDIIIPDADNFNINVKKNEYVKGIYTIIGKYK